MTKIEQKLLKKLDKLQKEYQHIENLYDMLTVDIRKEHEKTAKLTEALEPLAKRNEALEAHIVQLKGTMKWMMGCI